MKGKCFEYSRHTFDLVGHLLCSLEFPESRVLEEEGQVNHVPQVGVSTNTGLREHLVQVQLNGLQKNIFALLLKIIRSCSLLMSSLFL